MASTALHGGQRSGYTMVSRQRSRLIDTSGRVCAGLVREASRARGGYSRVRSEPGPRKPVSRAS